VQFADPDNANFKLIIEKGLKVIPVASREILRIKLNGQAVYQLQAFDLKSRGVFVKAVEATTTCTPVAIIAGSPDAFDGDRNRVDDQKDLIERIRKIPAERLLPQEGRIASIISSARKVSGRAVEEMQALIESTRQMVEDRNK
jgi:histone H3/H4